MTLEQAKAILTSVFGHTPKLDGAIMRNQYDVRTDWSMINGNYIAELLNTGIRLESIYSEGGKVVLRIELV